MRSSCRSVMVESADSYRSVGIGSQDFDADSLVTASDHFEKPRSQPAPGMNLAP